MKSLLEKFNQLDLNGRADLLNERGEYISTREYYSQKVNLYSMPGFLVELFYSPYLNRIEKIEVVKTVVQLNRHLVNIDIYDLIKTE